MTTAATEFEFVDVKDIDSNPNQPRTSKAGLDELAASIASLGVLQPVIAVADGKRYIVVAGHRRVAAAKIAGLKQVPVRVLPELTTGAQLSRLMAENEQREDLTAVELAHGYQAMLDTGAKEKDIIAATGATRAQIKYAKAIAKASQKAVAKLSTVSATLEEAAALVDFAGDKSKYEELERAIGTQGFSDTYKRALAQRELEAKCKAARDELSKAHIRILTDSETWSTTKLTSLSINPEDHATCPGHVAYVDPWNAAIAYYCTSPKLHGRAGSGSGSLSDEEKAARKAKREGRKLWAPVTGVRQEHLKEICTAAKPHPALLPFTAALAWESGLSCGAQRLYCTTWEEHLSAFARALDPRSPEQRLFALAAARLEQRITGWIENTGGATEQHDRAMWAPYYAVLTETGYAPADCEVPLTEDPAPRKTAPSHALSGAECAAIAGEPTPGVEVGMTVGVDLADGPDRTAIDGALLPEWPECGQDWGCANGDGHGRCTSLGRCNIWQRSVTAASNLSAEIRPDEDPLHEIAERTAAAFNAAQIEVGDSSATVFVGGAAGNLYATSASIMLKAMRENGCGRWSNDGVTYDLVAEGGRLVLTISGGTPEAAEADAHLLGTIAGTLFSADYTEALRAGMAHAFVAADPGGAS